VTCGHANKGSANSGLEKRPFFRTRRSILDSLNNPEKIGTKNRFLKTKFDLVILTSMLDQTRQNQTGSQMKIGYARISTKEQSFDLQIDALKKVGCKKIYREIISGARAERQVLNELLLNIRAGDVLVIWKLDRLGRFLKHLVELINDLMDKGIGLRTKNDPIDTTTAQGRLVFNIFASLTEFERLSRFRAGCRTALHSAEPARLRPCLAHPG
jgi:hypothetical protein